MCFLFWPRRIHKKCRRPCSHAPQRFDFHRIPTPVLAAHLREICDREGIDADDEALSLIAKNAAGGMRDAIQRCSIRRSPLPAIRSDRHAVTQMIGGLDDDALHTLVACAPKRQHRSTHAAARESSLPAAATAAHSCTACSPICAISCSCALAPPPTAAHRAKPCVSKPPFQPAQLEQLLAKAAEAERDMRIAPER